MTAKQVPVQSGRVTTEGDDLYYEVRGQENRLPLLMIAPGGGDGWQYSWVADILADEYKVITYDRRANARSTMNVPQNFEISQQSRDAVAVLHAAGETSAFVFGNSSGAVIALDHGQDPARRRCGRSWCTKRRFRACCRMPRNGSVSLPASIRRHSASARRWPRSGSCWALTFRSDS